MSVQVHVIRGIDLPVANMKTSDPFVKIYANGAIKSLIGQTRVENCNNNPQWDELFTFSGVRGCRIFFDVYDKDQLKINQLGYCTFDPLFMEYNKRLILPLTKVCKKKGQNASIEIMVLPLDIPRPRITANEKPIYSKPIYISFEPSERWIPATNPMTNSTTKGLPYPVPFQLSAAILLNDSTLKLVTADDRSAYGVNHSGHHPCRSFNTFTQAIRIDPVVLSKSDINSIYILVNTQNFTPLCAGSQDKESVGAITIWKSNEEPNKYRKGIIDQKFESNAQSNLTPHCKFVIPYSDSAVFCSALVGHSTKNEVSFEKHNVFFPTEQNTITPQTPHHAMKALLAGKQVDERSFYGLPICSPLLLSKAFPDFPSKIHCKLTNIKKHHFVVSVHSNTLECLDSTENQARFPKRLCNGAIIATETLAIDLKNLPENAAYVTVGLFGSHQLFLEPISDKNIIEQGFVNVGRVFTSKSDQTPKLQLIANNKYSLQEFRLPASKQYTTFQWFYLFREPFGNWSIVSVRIPTFATKGYELVNQMVKTIKETCK